MQNPHVDVEFQSEIKIMARIEHQSLVRFYGYMECGEERIVVVEYVPNGTLREHLDSKPPLLLCSALLFHGCSASNFVHLSSPSQPIMNSTNHNQQGATVGSWTWARGSTSPSTWRTP